MKLIDNFQTARTLMLFLLINLSTNVFAVSHIEQGDSALAALNVTKAIQQYQMELSHNSDSVIARTRLAKCYMRKGYQASASKLIQEAMQINPTDVDAMILQSRLFLGASQTQQAKELLKQVLRISPNNIEAYQYLAGIYNDIGNTQAADEIYSIINTLNK